MGVLMPATLELKAEFTHKNPTPEVGGWWGVRCPRCRAWLTRYDFSAGDALSIARGVLASGRHQCGKAGA